MNKHEQSMTCKNCGHHKTYHQTQNSGERKFAEIECIVNIPTGSKFTCGGIGNCKRFCSIDGHMI